MDKPSKQKDTVFRFVRKEFEHRCSYCGDTFFSKTKRSFCCGKPACVVARRRRNYLIEKQVKSQSKPN